MRFLILIIPFVFVFASEVNKSKLINCYDIFEQRRGELESKISQIEEQRQAFIALKDASMNILKKKEKKITQKLQEINITLNKIEKTKKENEKLLKQYQQILEEIKKSTSSKLIQSYSKMRAGNAAKIIQEMDNDTALSILSKLSPKVLSKIFAKMDSIKAAKFSEQLKNFIPKRR
jgi:flagellar motility protein MotE (MotC chaperone)